MFRKIIQKIKQRLRATTIANGRAIEKSQILLSQ